MRKNEGGEIIANRKIGKILAELENGLVGVGVDPEDASDLVDSFEESVEDLLSDEEEPEEEETSG